MRMRLEHESSEQLKKNLLCIVGRHLDLNEYRVFFFGSRVAGRGTERSDIDVGIEGPAPVPGSMMAEMREALEQLPLLYKIDIVDFQNVSTHFKKVAKQNIARITI